MENPVTKVPVDNKTVLSNRDSIWWREFLLDDFSVDSTDKRFAGYVLCKFNDGEGTTFWHANWLGNQSLAVSFPQIYIKAINGGCFVAENGSWIKHSWSWNLADFMVNNSGFEPGLWAEFT